VDARGYSTPNPLEAETKRAMLEGREGLRPCRLQQAGPAHPGPLRRPAGGRSHHRCRGRPPGDCGPAAGGGRGVGRWPGSDRFRASLG